MTTDTPPTNDKPIATVRTNVNEKRRGAVEEVPLPSSLKAVDDPSRQEAPPPAKPARPTTLAEAAPWLAKPFRQQDIELKPGAVTKDRTRALGMPYADPRVYFSRLDRVCGVENWSNSYTMTDRGVVCALTIFGVTKSATGDYPIDRADENAATSAEAQAFKRACAAFGLGRYLYALSPVWGDYDQEKKRLVDPAGMVRQMYAQAEIVGGGREE